MVRRMGSVLPAVVAALSLLWAATPMTAKAETITAGAQVTGKLQQTLSTKTAHDGDPFTLVTASGSTISGHLSEVVASTLTKKAHMKLNVETIRFSNGSTSPIHGVVIGVAAKKNYDIAKAAGEVLVGNIVGNVIGKHLGTNIGGLVGLLGGALYAYNTAADFVLPAGSDVTIRLTEQLVTPP